MASRVKIEANVWNVAGSKVPVMVENASVEIVQPGTTTRIPVYAAAAGGSPLTQPFPTNAVGVVTQSMYVESGQAFERLATWTHTPANGSPVTLTAREYGVALGADLEARAASVESGVDLASAADKQVPRWDASGGTLIWKDPLSFDVRDYGAVGAGAAAGINAAIVAAEALVGVGGVTAQGVEVVMPRADWIGDAAIVYSKGGFKLRGQGQYQTIIKQASGVAAPVLGPSGSAGTCEPVICEDFGVSGFVNASNTGGIDLRGAARSVVRRCYIAGVQSFGVRIAGYGIASTGDAMYSLVAENDIANLGRGAAHVQFSNAASGGSHPDRARVVNNIFRSVWVDYTKTDGAITSGLAVLTSASGTFTAADVGKPIYVNGAGPAGAVLSTKISAYTSATQVTLAANASTTVSGATYKLSNAHIGVLVDTAATLAGAFSADGLWVSGNTMQGVAIPYRVNTQGSVFAGNTHEVTGTGETITVDVIAGPANFTSAHNTFAWNEWATYGDANKLIVNDGGSSTSWLGHIPGNGMSGGSNSDEYQFGLTGFVSQQDIISVQRLRTQYTSANRPAVMLEGAIGSSSNPSTFYGIGRDNPESTYINGAAVKAKINGTDGNYLDNGSGAVKLSSGPLILGGSGTPEAAVTAPLGSLFLRTNGGAGTTLYVKESGAGNTGWVAK